jgi:hypothetical protein
MIDTQESSTMAETNTTLYPVDTPVVVVRGKYRNEKGKVAGYYWTTAGKTMYEINFDDKSIKDADMIEESGLARINDYSFVVPQTLTEQGGAEIMIQRVRDGIYTATLRDHADNRVDGLSAIVRKAAIAQESSLRGLFEYDLMVAFGYTGTRQKIGRAMRDFMRDECNAETMLQIIKTFDTLDALRKME